MKTIQEKNGEVEYVLTCEEYRRLHEENIALRKCAIKYLDYLRIPDQEKALESDMKNKEMLK